MRPSSPRPRPDLPGPGQESVWSYPRPARLEPTGRRLRVEHGGVVVADTRRGFRVLETSHPPTYYVPLADVLPGALAPAAGESACEWKGAARYLDLHAGGRIARRAAWTYPDPSPPFLALQGAVAFYAGRVDACFVDNECVRPQDGAFYGGWITADLAGPFKGPPGTELW